MAGYGSIVGGFASMIPYFTQISDAKKQDKKADELERKYKMPAYEIPQSAETYYNMLLGAAGAGGYAGQGVAEDKIRASTVGAINEAAQYGQDPGSIMQTIAASKGAEGNAMLESGALAARQQERDMQNLGGYTTEMAAYQSKKWEHEKYNPWKKAVDSIAALRGAAMLNRRQGQAGVVKGFSEMAGGMGGGAGGGIGGMMGGGSTGSESKAAQPAAAGSTTDQFDPSVNEKDSGAVDWNNMTDAQKEAYVAWLEAMTNK